MSYQVPTVITDFAHQLMHFSWTGDPGTASDIPIALCWRAMWLEHATIRWEAASTSLSVTASTCWLSAVASGTAISTNTAITDALSTITAAATTTTFTVNTTRNSVAKGELLALSFDAAAASGMGIVTVQAQFTTKAK